MPALPDHATGPRLTVRRWQLDDVDALGAAVTASIEHLRPWMPWVALEPLTPAARSELIEGWQRDREGGDLFAGMFLGHLVVGSCGLHRRLGPGALEIGYWVHVDHVGHGYASEAAAALTSLAFTVSDIERVEIHHDVANAPSAAVPRRLGFEWLGEHPDEITAPGESGIEGRWAMTRAAWAARSEVR